MRSSGHISPDGNLIIIAREPFSCKNILGLFLGWVVLFFFSLLLLGIIMNFLIVLLITEPPSGDYQSVHDVTEPMLIILSVIVGVVCLVVLILFMIRKVCVEIDEKKVTLIDTAFWRRRRFSIAIDQLGRVELDREFKEHKDSKGRVTREIFWHIGVVDKGDHPIHLLKDRDRQCIHFIAERISRAAHVPILDKTGIEEQIIYPEETDVSIKESVAEREDLSIITPLNQETNRIVIPIANNWVSAIFFIGIGVGLSFFSFVFLTTRIPVTINDQRTFLDPIWSYVGFAFIFPISMLLLGYGLHIFLVKYVIRLDDDRFVITSQIMGMVLRQISSIPFDEIEDIHVACEEWSSSYYMIEILTDRQIFTLKWYDTEEDAEEDQIYLLRMIKTYKT